MVHRVSAIISFGESFRRLDKLSASTSKTGHTLPFTALDFRRALDPESTFLKTWHQVLLAGVIYDLFVIPFVCTFKSDMSFSQILEVRLFYAWEVLFCLDIYVKLNTGFYEDGNVHRDLHNARIKYLKSYEFVVDIITLLPLALIIPLDLHNCTSKIVLETPKVLRIMRIPKYLTALDAMYAKHFELLRLFKVLVGIVLLSHLIACVRFSFGYNVHHDNEWLPELPEMEEEGLEGHHRIHPVRTQYLMSLFWAFGILTGLFEGELPHKISEFIFTIAVAICGFGMFTYLCGTLFMLSKCESGQTEAATARINQLKHILTFHRVPDHLQIRIVEYLLRFYTDVDSSDRDVMKLLCPSISNDIQVELMMSIMGNVPVFANCSEKFLFALTSLLERMSFPAQCTLFQVGEYGDAMYIIHSGVLDVILNNKKVRELRKTDFVGELSLFSDHPRSATVVTVTYCVLYKLSRFHTEKVLEGYPALVPGIRKLVANVIEITQQHDKGEPKTPLTNVTADTAKIGCRSSFLRTPSHGFTDVAKKKGSTVAPMLVNSLTTDNQMIGAHHEHQQQQHKQPAPQLRRLLTVRKHHNSDAVRAFYDGYTRPNEPTNATNRWWRRLLLSECIDSNTYRRLWWVVGLETIMLINFIAVPLQLVFPVFGEVPWYIYVLYFLADFYLWIDLYVNFNLSYVHESETIRDPAKSAQRYLRGCFFIDLICIFPYHIFASTAEVAVTRIPRLISITYIEGFSTKEDAWIPVQDLIMRPIKNDDFYVDYQNITYAAGDPHVLTVARMQYFRSFYYATNVLTALGLTIEPSSDVQYGIALIFMFSGFFITAIVVDNVQKRFTASAFEEKEFFTVRSRLQLFLRRQNAPFLIHHRVNLFLEYWWASHRGAMIEELLVDLPLGYKREILRSICKPALQTLALLAGIRPYLNAVENAFVDNAKFVLYGQGETLYWEGDNAHALFFLLEGHLSLVVKGEQIREIPQGGFFGTRALNTNKNGAGYAEDAIAASGCVVLLLSRQKLIALREIFPSFDSAMHNLEQRLLGVKLSRKRTLVGTSSGASTKWFALKGILYSNSCWDPDARVILVWETWLFVVMTVQWILVITHICFGVHPSHDFVVDAVTVVLESFFVMDLFVRSRLGYHEFGDKVMDIKLIRRRYFRSRQFILDLMALLPLFAINWILPSKRYEILNINKLVRLSKVPFQLHELQQRYLKFTTELRLFKLLYYTFLLSHVFGCLYFNFASNASQVYTSRTSVHATNFGTNHWLLDESLEHASMSRQYFAALFWAFALMSASNQGELPKTSAQCIFSVATMITGFFLFAYVVGNFTDIIELVDAENRKFNANFGSVRHLLSRFTLSQAIENKLKRFYFFKRFHSITQEQLLEKCLPPSLVTDIRLLNLNAMIEKVPFLSNMEGSITRMLVSQFSQVLILRDEFVYKYGSEGSDMYFIYTGVLTVLAPGNQGKRAGDHAINGNNRLFNQATRSISGYIDQELVKLSDITSGDFFGENALFSDVPRNASIRAKTSCILYSLSRHSLEMVFELYPDWKKRVLQTVKVQQKQQRLNVSVNDTPKEAFVSLPNSTRSRTTPDVDTPSPSMVGYDQARDVRVLNQQHLIPVHRGVRRFVPQWVVALRNGVDVQSKLHVIWLKVITTATFFIAIVVPYRIAFDLYDRWHGIYIALNIGEICCALLFVGDIWVNWKLKENELSMDFYEENQHQAYKRERVLYDIIAALPLEYLFSSLVVSSSTAAWLRMTRCVKVFNIVHYLKEIHRQSVSFEWARLKSILSLYGLVMFWCACSYLLLAEYEGYGDEWDAWLPSKKVDITNIENPSLDLLLLRLFRGLFFAVTTFVKKGRTFVPESTGTDIFAICLCFLGLLVMALMIGEIASLYISYIGNEVTFLKNHISVELCLTRWKVTKDLETRVHLFLSTLWSSHKGVNYQAIFDDLPKNIRHEVLMEISDLPLQCFIQTVFRPLVHGDSTSLNSLAVAIAERLRFECYPRGESVIVEGTIPRAAYFVIKGYLVRATNTTRLSDVDPFSIRFKKGNIFGHQGLLAHSVSEYSVRALKACDLLSLTADDLLEVLKSHNYFSVALNIAKELLYTLRENNNGHLPRSRDVWGHNLKKLLLHRRVEWAMGLGTAATPPPDPSSLPVGPLTPALNTTTTSQLGASQLKGVTLWTYVLAGVVDMDTPTACLEMFEHFLELIVPHGFMLDRTSSRVLSAKNESKIAANKSKRLRKLVLRVGDPGKIKGVAEKFSNGISTLADEFDEPRSVKIMRLN